MDNIVVLDALISKNPYKLLNKCPLPKMIKMNDRVRNSNVKTFGTRYKNSFLVSNSIVAKSYGFSKLHKTSVKMRQRVSSTNTPSYKIAKWLVDQFRKLPP